MLTSQFLSERVMAMNANSIAAKRRAFHEAKSAAIVLLALALASVPASSGRMRGRQADDEETPCEYELSIPLRSAEYRADGSVWDAEREELYPPGTYWKYQDSRPEKREIYVGCPCLLGRPCLRKCCPLGQQFNESVGCVPDSPEVGSFRVSVSSDDGYQQHSVVASEHFYLLFRNTCYYGYYRLMPETYKDNEYFLRSSDGYLSMPVAGVDALWTDEFCVDNVLGLDSPRAFLCLPLFKRMTAPVPSIGSPVFLLISAPIACATFLAYVFLKGTRQTLDAKLRVLMLFNIFYGFLLHACVMIYAGKLKEFQTLTLGIGSQFFTLAAGCWISVMLFCISQSSWVSTDNSEEIMAKKLVLYGVYSWGVPLLAVLLSAVNLKGGELPYNEVNPGYAEARAWIQILQGALLYFFGADAFLLVLNTILSAINVFKLHQLSKEISVLGDNTVFSKHKEALQNHKKRLTVCFILLLIYSISRMVEAACWMIEKPEPRLYIIDVTDFIAEILICAGLAYEDGIFTILRKKILATFPAKTNT
ncbi:probable G-protein coupled receptor Mth-like 4 [Ischnura elegans]|uniref:probable G-protein coupled receptor Mth-like 4 n=1 Tax=Ischnura elegans TaxID=197161 RepID=UPI001ED8AE61|nr:probable G-protein coupled receptor Mth-like 4 [Ischnura elegans]